MSLKKEHRYWAELAQVIFNNKKSYVSIRNAPLWLCCIYDSEIRAACNTSSGRTATNCTTHNCWTVCGCPLQKQTKYRKSKSQTFLVSQICVTNKNHLKQKMCQPSDSKQPWGQNRNEKGVINKVWQVFTVLFNLNKALTGSSKWWPNTVQSPLEV